MENVPVVNAYRDVDEYVRRSQEMGGIFSRAWLTASEHERAAMTGELRDAFAPDPALDFSPLAVSHVLSRMLPDAFRDCQVQRLALFFQSLRETLRAIAPHDRDNPRIVLLTPGPYNETYFEQAFLARYLGIALVEGSDLTVRDNRVYLKLLGGLQPVDVILRRLDDA